MYDKVAILLIVCIFLFGCGGGDGLLVESEDEEESLPPTKNSAARGVPTTTQRDPLTSLKISLIFSIPMDQGGYTVRTTIGSANSSNVIVNEQILELAAIQNQTHNITISEIPVGANREIKIEIFREEQRLFQGSDTIDIMSSSAANQLSFAIGDRGNDDNGRGDDTGGDNDEIKIGVFVIVQNVNQILEDGLPHGLHTRGEPKLDERFIIGHVFNGAVGKVVDGPVKNDNHTWWKIHWNRDNPKHIVTWIPGAEEICRQELCKVWSAQFIKEVEDPVLVRK